MICKQFSRELYDKSDYIAKEKIKEYLTKKGVLVVEQPNRFDIDLTASFFAEVEVKECWNESFPYDTVHIPARKEKFITGKTLFFILNKNLTQAIIIPDRLLKEKIEIPNKYVQNGELFFDIPLSNVEIVEVRN